jgi:hypothetical protein
MATIGGSNIITNGLVLALDAANRRSYVPGSTTWNDISGNRNSGSLVNGPTFNSANGGSIVFDGVDDSVDLDVRSILNFERTDPISICSVVRCTNTNAISNNIIGNSLGTTPPYKGWYFTLFYRASLKSTAVTFTLVNKGDAEPLNYLEVATPEFSISQNIIYHVAVSYNGNSSSTGVNLYINAIPQTKVVSKDTLTNTIAISNKTTVGNRTGGGAPFYGNIYNTLVYNRALTATEVLQNYEALKSRYGL